MFHLSIEQKEDEREINFRDKHAFWMYENKKVFNFLFGSHQHSDKTEMYLYYRNNIGPFLNCLISSMKIALTLRIYGYEIK